RPLLGGSPRPAHSPPFPYTTLFRSADGRPPQAIHPLPGGEGRNEVLRIDTAEGRFVWRRRLPPVDRPGAAAGTELAAHRLAAARSEEHTSELQSRENLVCRLLLEKK